MERCRYEAGIIKIDGYQTSNSPDSGRAKIRVTASSPDSKVLTPELKTSEWDILNPDLLTYLEIKFMRKTSHI